MEVGWALPTANVFGGQCPPYTGTEATMKFNHPSLSKLAGLIGANAIRAWNRINRTQKIQVIAVRISNRKKPAEKFLKSIATQYVWAKKPPASDSK